MGRTGKEKRIFRRGKDGGDEITCKKDNAATWGEKVLKREDERSPFVFPR